MKEFENILGYTFKDKGILILALTHSSFANENKNKGILSNERLEFLGDSILGFTTAEYLYNKYSDKPEGELTRMRAALVCEQSLVAAAAELQIGKYLRLGRGEESGGGRKRASILADAVESVLGAVYLDGGSEPVKTIINRIILSKAENVSTGISDYKTRLQELVQQEKEQVLSYEMTGEEGPDHDKSFMVRVLLNGKTIGEGKGKSKKEAEQSAAKSALMKLSK